MVHIPDVVGAVVVAYNVPGVGPGMQLSGPVQLLRASTSGKITMLERSANRQAQPEPEAARRLDIFVTHRSDGSGTTAIFTDYLSKSAARRGHPAPALGKSIDWPVGLGGKGNAGVAGLLKAHTDSLSAMWSWLTRCRT